MMKALPPLGLSGCTNGRQRGSDHPEQSSCDSPGEKSKFTLYARDKSHLHQGVRIPEGAPEVLEGEHPHEVLEQEEDGEGGGEGHVPIEYCRLTICCFLLLSLTNIRIKSKSK